MLGDAAARALLGEQPGQASTKLLGAGIQPKVMPPRFGFTSTVRSPLSQVIRSSPV